MFDSVCEMAPLNLNVLTILNIWFPTIISRCLVTHKWWICRTIQLILIKMPAFACPSLSPSCIDFSDYISFGFKGDLDTYLMCGHLNFAFQICELNSISPWKKSGKGLDQGYSASRARNRVPVLFLGQSSFSASLSQVPSGVRTVKMEKDKKGHQIIES